MGQLTIIQHGIEQAQACSEQCDRHTGVHKSSTNGGLTYWRKCGSLGLDESRNLTCNISYRTGLMTFFNHIRTCQKQVLIHRLISDNAWRKSMCNYAVSIISIYSATSLGPRGSTYLLTSHQQISTNRMKNIIIKTNLWDQELLELVISIIKTVSFWNTLLFVNMLIFHPQAVLEYLKFDIEFWEFEVLQQIVRTGVLNQVKQIAFELHMAKFHEEVGGSALYTTMHEALLEMERQGFRKFLTHQNQALPFFNYRTGRNSKGCCFELYYINLRFLAHKLRHQWDLDKRSNTEIRLCVLIWIAPKFIHKDTRSALVQAVTRIMDSLTP